MNPQDFQSIHLFSEQTGWPSSQTECAPLELPPGVSRFENGTIVSRLHEDSQARAAVLLEPLLGRKPQLLLLNLGSHSVRVNDQLAPALAVLRERDQFRIGCGPAWQVGVFHRPRIQPPSPEEEQLQCLVCLNHLERSDLCFWCPGCGAGMHLKRANGPENAEPCAGEGEPCLGCTRPISFRESYLTEPDINRE